MSTTVDERVVSMQFDNKHFEENVKTSMSTLDKLKQALQFKGASKGFNEIDAASKKVNMTHLGQAVEVVQAKFSALQVIGVTALANITNSAVNAGKKIVSALTIDPIKTGFQEYETQINATQTILANTQSKGTTIDDVNAALKELNDYADLTIYNFTEMTRNIGTFTAAGVDLETSTNAIKGIANLAAVSGSTSQQASTAMYQLSQALASGTVKLMDWNSVVNAGMGGQVFQDALKETARVHGIAIDSMIEEQGSFRETLSEGWLTSEILTETLQKFTLTTEGLTEAEIEANREMLRAKGYTEDQIDEIFKLGQTATDAATKVKTFTQLWDVLKEAAQSGWSQTWKLLVGDFEQAKNLLTPISEFLTGIIDGISDARNLVLESALGRGFAKLTESFNEIIKPAQKAVDTVTGAVDAVTDLGTVVDEVILGKFGNGEERFNALGEAGYNYCEVQNKVNEALGNSFRYTEEQIEAQNKLLGSKKATNETTKEEAEATTEVTEEQKDYIKRLAKMNDEQLKAAEVNEDQVAALKELKTTADQLGIPLDEFIDNLDQIDGRWLLLNGFKNIGMSLVDVFKAIRDAWQGIFPPKSIEEKAEGLFNLIGAFHKLTASIPKLYDEAGNLTDTGDKLVRTLQGVFALIDIITTITSGAFKIAIQTVGKLLGMADLDILSVTAAIGDAIVAVRDWIDEHNILAKGIDVIIPYLKKAAGAISGWIEGLKEADNIPQYIVQGLVNGLKAGVEAVVGVVTEIATTIIETVCSILGIESPSKVFFEIGGHVISGFVNGIKNGIPKAWEWAKNLGSKAIEAIKNAFGDDNVEKVETSVSSFVKKVGDFISNIDWGAVLAAGIGVGMLLTIKKIADALEAFAAPLAGLGDMFEGIGDAARALGKSFKASAFKKNATAVLLLSVAIALLASSVATLADIEPKKLWGAIGALVALAAVVAALSIAAAKMGSLDISIQLGRIAPAMLMLAGSLLIVAGVMKILSTIKMEDVPTILATMGIAVAGIAGILLTFGAIAKEGKAAYLDKAGAMIFKLSLGLLVLAAVMKIAGSLDTSEIAKGIAVIAAFSLLCAALVAVSKFAGEHASKAGGMLLKMSIAMLIMVGVVKAASNLSEDEIIRGMGLVKMVGMLFTGFIAISALAGKNGAKAGTMLLLMSGAFLIMTSVIKQVSKMSNSDIEKGIGVITTVSILFAGLIAVSKLAGEHAAKAGIMLLAMSAAMIVLTGLLFVISKMDTAGVYKALGVIVVLETMFIGLIAVTKLAKDVKGTLIALTVAVAILTLAVVALTFIDPTKLAGAVAAVSALVGVFAGLVAATSLLKDTKGMIKTMATLMAVVLGIAAILAIMSKIGAEASIQTAGAISMVLMAMSASMAILGAVGAKAMPAMAAMGIMTAIVAGLAVILGLLAGLDITTSIQTATSLSILLLSMSGAVAILSLIGPVASGATAGMLALGQLVLGLGLVMAALGGLVTYIPQVGEWLDTGLPILEKLGYALGSFVGNIIGGFADGALAGLPAIGQHLTDFMNNLQGFIDGCSGIDPAMMEGAKALAEVIILLTAAELLDGLSSLIGGTDMSGFAGQLTAFAQGMIGFSNEIKGADIDVAAMEEAAKAGKAMAELANEIPKKGGLLQDIMGESELGQFGASIVAFGAAMKDFSENVDASSIDTAAITACKEAGTEMVSLATKIPKSGGWAQDIMGESDLAAFGASIVAFGSAMKLFSESVDASSIDTDAITACATAGTEMTSLATKVPKTGGWAQKIMGSDDIGKFGSKIVSFGKAMMDFSENVDASSIDTAAIQAAADGGKTLADFAKYIEDKDIFGMFGGSDLEDFCDPLAGFGEAIGAFSEKVGSMSNASAIYTAVNAAKSLATMCEGDTNQLYNLINAFEGAAITEEMGTQMANFGKAIKTFASSCTGISLDTVQNGVSAGKLVVGLANSISLSSGVSSLMGDDGGMDTFGEELTSFASAMKSFADEVAGINTKNLSAKVTDFKKITSQVSGIGKTLGTGITKSVTSSSGSVNKSITVMLSGALKTVNASKSKFNSAGKALMTGFGIGLNSMTSKVSSIGGKVSSAAATAVKSETIYNRFYSAGKYCVQGFAAGITAETWRAEARAAAMASAAEAAAKEELDINSPSKVFRAIGYSVPEGFAMGIDRMAYMASDSSEAMADTAINSMKGAISRIGDAISTDIDAQPTIRPVLDLSEVEAGAGTINGMFGSGVSIEAWNNARAINTMMNDRIQNGGNKDVVSAIDKLSKMLGNVGGNTYNVNGVTYDDGSNIAGAVRTLIRATTIEGRA